jgi:uncharacterized protein YecE (DUF72 family)
MPVPRLRATQSSLLSPDGTPVANTERFHRFGSSVGARACRAPRFAREIRVARQLGLFSASAPVVSGAARDAELAARLPGHVFFGTSSWTFPGWAGIVYEGKPSERWLKQSGLGEYARYPLFRSVGIDRSYYRPLDAATLRDYGSQLPRGFRCVLKVYRLLTSFADPETGADNPAFLSPQVFESEVVAPLLAEFREHVAGLVLTFPPATGARFSSADFAARLRRFLDAAARDFPIAVELRSRQLLTPRYLEVLQSAGASHVFNYWEDMPEIAEQLELAGVEAGPLCIARLLIPPGRRYEDRKNELRPFDKLVDPQPRMRADVVRLSQACQAAGKVLFVIVNNKAEGSSPLTIRALAEAMAAASTP